MTRDQIRKRDVEAALRQLVKEGELRTYMRHGTRYWIDAKVKRKGANTRK